MYFPLHHSDMSLLISTLVKFFGSCIYLYFKSNSRLMCFVCMLYLFAFLFLINLCVDILSYVFYHIVISIQSVLQYVCWILPWTFSMLCCFLIAVFRQLLFNVISDVVELRSTKFIYLSFVFWFFSLIFQFHLSSHLLDYLHNVKLYIGLWAIVALGITRKVPVCFLCRLYYFY